MLVLLGVGLLAFSLAALAQAVTGFGSSLVAVPILAVVVGPVDAVIAATLASVLLTAGAWRRERTYTHRSRVWTLAVAGVAGMPLGWALISALPQDVLTAVIAVTVLLLVGVLSVGVRVPPGPTAQGVSGFVSGALLTSTGMNGPPLVAALHDLEPRSFRATLQATFCLQDAVAVAGFVVLGHVTGQALLLAVTGIVALPVGWSLGDRLFQRVPADKFRPLVLAGLLATATATLLSAL